MSRVVGLIVLGLLAAGVVAGWMWIRDEPTTANGTPAEAAVRWQSSTQCKVCHQKQWDEWHGSHHQIAYTNPEVRKLSDDFRQKDCQACHLPRPVAETGFGQRVLPRQTRPNEGVDCITCHLGADGSILGRNGSDKGCEPKASAELVSVELCASCHNQHNTTDQWKASHFAREGTTCNDCHMKEHGHRFPGAHDLAMLKSAGVLTVEKGEGKVILALENRGAGHNFPTEERHRAVDIEYRFVVADKAAAGDWQRVFRFRQPYRDEPGENTQLPAGEKKAFDVAIPDGATAVHVRLWYRLNPFAKDDDPASSLLDEKELPLR